jgi:hypothetical protein
LDKHGRIWTRRRSRYSCLTQPYLEKAEADKKRFAEETKAYQSKKAGGVEAEEVEAEEEEA